MEKQNSEIELVQAIINKEGTTSLVSVLYVPEQNGGSKQENKQLLRVHEA